MKNILALFFWLVVTDICGQQVPPTYYLNSAEIDINSVHIKPSSVDQMRVEKKRKGGEVYIETKRPITFLTLDMILKKHSDIVDSLGQVVYIVNDKVVNDKSAVKIDASFFIEIKNYHLEKVIYIDERNRSLILVDIQLLNEKPKPVIRLRGDESVQTIN